MGGYYAAKQISHAYNSSAHLTYDFPVGLLPCWQFCLWHLATQLKLPDLTSGVEVFNCPLFLFIYFYL